MISDIIYKYPRFKSIIVIILTLLIIIILVIYQSKLHLDSITSIILISIISVISSLYLYKLYKDGYNTDSNIRKLFDIEEKLILDHNNIIKKFNNILNKSIDSNIELSKFGKQNDDSILKLYNDIQPQITSIMNYIYNLDEFSKLLYIEFSIPEKELSNYYDDVIGVVNTDNLEFEKWKYNYNYTKSKDNKQIYKKYWDVFDNQKIQNNKLLKDLNLSYNNFINKEKINLNNDIFNLDNSLKLENIDKLLTDKIEIILQNLDKINKNDSDIIKLKKALSNFILDSRQLIQYYLDKTFSTRSNITKYTPNDDNKIKNKLTNCINLCYQIEEKLNCK